MSVKWSFWLEVSGKLLILFLVLVLFGFLHNKSTYHYHLTARFALGHVNEEEVDTYEHLPDMENANNKNAQEKDYIQLPPKYENQNVLQNSSRVDDNGYLNPMWRTSSKGMLINRHVFEK